MVHGRERRLKRKLKPKGSRNRCKKGIFRWGGVVLHRRGGGRVCVRERERERKDMGVEECGFS